MCNSIRHEILFVIFKSHFYKVTFLFEQIRRKLSYLFFFHDISPFWTALVTEVWNRTFVLSWPLEAEEYEWTYADQLIIMNLSVGTRRRYNVEIWLKIGWNVDNVISTLFWRRFASVGSTLTTKRWNNVDTMFADSTRDFDAVSTSVYLWVMVDEIHKSSVFTT